MDISDEDLIRIGGRQYCAWMKRYPDRRVKLLASDPVMARYCVARELGCRLDEVVLVDITDKRRGMH